LTVWISDEALGLWSAARRTTLGRQPRYSDLAIELCLTLGVVFKQPLRQTQGLMRGIARILGVEIAVSDFSTLSRRGNGLILQTSPRADSHATIHLVVDSTGLKIFGEGAPSADCFAIACRAADGAYDGEPTSDLLAARFGSMIEVTIPPPKTAILSANAGQDPTARDCHIAAIAARGRMAWQKASGYNQRSRGETLMGRWKGIIGPKLKARTFGNQKTEAKIGVRVLNRMTGLGRPSFERTA